MTSPLVSSGRSRFSYSESTDLLGKGTYASVFSAVDTHGLLGRVALKRIEFDHTVEGCPLLLLREVGIIARLKHPNLVPVVAVNYSPLEGVACIAFELLQSDLRQHINRHGTLKGRVLCDATHQLASGMEFLHAHGILHRDLKPQNVLVKTASDGKLVLKIGDFGLARTYTPQLTKYTKEVMTLWYRCPELLLGGSIYGPSGDCWSLGCLVGEMASGQAMFSGESEVAVMFKIFKTIGTPNQENWAGVSGLSNYSGKFPKWSVNSEARRETFASIIEGGLSNTSAETPKDRVRRDILRVHMGGGRVSPESTKSSSSFNKLLVAVMEGIFQYTPSNRMTAEEVRLRTAQQLGIATSPRVLVRE